MRRSRTIVWVLFPVAATGVYLAYSGAVLHAQSSAGTSSAAKTPKYVSCQFGTTQYLSTPRTVLLNQGVEFGQDDTTLKTDAAVALLDKDQHLISAKAAGAVHIYDTQDDLVGQHGSVDFTKHLATLQDGIVLIVKPGKREANAAGSSPRKQFKDPATLTCQGMTYDYRNKIGRIPGPLIVTQAFQSKDGPQTRTLTADAGLYNGKAETIQLVGDIKGTFSDGSVIEGDTRPGGKPVLINIKEGSEAIFVPFKTIGHFTVKSQSDDETDKDDEPDLTLPVPPPHTPSAVGAPPAASNSTPPVRTTPGSPVASSPSGPAQSVPAQTPLPTVSAGTP